MKREADGIVYYALDNSSLHLYLAELSLRSLRMQNRSFGVRVFLYDVTRAATVRKFEKLGAEVRCLKRPVRAADRLPATFLKWLALEHVREKRALYADADTWFFEDPSVLFRKFSSKDFYAREEYGTRPGIGFQMLGNLVLEPQIHPGKFKAISRMLDFKPGPVFNSGVMIFNGGAAARMADRIGEVRELYRLFASKPAYYPAENPHIMDEIVASILFGRLTRFACGRIPKNVSPWYCEWKAGVVEEPGVVMHSWTKYSPFFVREFAGARAAAKLPFLIPVRWEYGEY